MSDWYKREGRLVASAKKLRVPECRESVSEYLFEGYAMNPCVDNQAHLNMPVSHFQPLFSFQTSGLNEDNLYLE